jgi:hypothetical protein
MNTAIMIHSGPPMYHSVFTVLLIYDQTTYPQIYESQQLYNTDTSMLVPILSLIDTFVALVPCLRSAVS